jgi:Transposase DDE domain
LVSPLKAERKRPPQTPEGCSFGPSSAIPNHEKIPSATEKKEESYRLLTNVIDLSKASAQELAELYPECWEIELRFKEIKNVMKKRVVTLRGKSPELMKQEFWSMLLVCLEENDRPSGNENRVRSRDEISTTGALEIIKKTLTGPILNPPLKTVKTVIKAMIKEIATKKR